MDQAQIPLDLVISIVFKVLGGCMGVFILMGTGVAGFVKMLHNDLKKTVNEIHIDLKPLKEDVIVLKNEVKNIKENHDELKERVTEHGKDISILKKYLPNDKN